MSDEQRKSPIVNTFNFETLIQETVKKAGYLTEFFRLNLIYYELISGKGLEFDRIKRYMPGGDTRRIDWKIFARTDKLFLRTYKEERELNIVIVLDVSDSMLLGTKEYTKNEYGALVAGILAYSAIEAGDKAGGGVFSSEALEFVDPDNDFIHLMDTMSTKHFYGGSKNWMGLVNELISNYEEDSIVFIISDFINSNPEKFLPELASRFSKVYGIMVRDPSDYELPDNVGKMYLKDPETGKLHLVDIDNTKEEYEVRARMEIEHIKDLFHEYGQRCFSITTGEDFSRTFIKSMGDEEVEIL
ncbi:MAG: DUF58 domain-containing protein [Nanobdellota archaeon]